MPYEENVLLKLKRQYSKDEYVSALLKIIKEKDIEIGVLTSERDEYSFLLAKLSRMDNKTKSRMCQSKYYKEMRDNIKNLRKTNKKLLTDYHIALGKLNNKNI